MKTSLWEKAPQKYILFLNRKLSPINEPFLALWFRLLRTNAAPSFKKKFWQRRSLAVQRVVKGWPPMCSSPRNFAAFDSLRGEFSNFRPNLQVDCGISVPSSDVWSLSCNGRVHAREVSRGYNDGVFNLHKHISCTYIHTIKKNWGFL